MKNLNLTFREKWDYEVKIVVKFENGINQSRLF